MTPYGSLIKKKEVVIVHLTGCLPLIWLFLLTACAGRTLYPLPGKGGKSAKLPIQTLRPYNIAHRGSNGEIPEETAAAYLVDH